MIDKYKYKSNSCVIQKDHKTVEGIMIYKMVIKKDFSFPIILEKETKFINVPNSRKIKHDERYDKPTFLNMDKCHAKLNT